jgi:hypothetical protein
MATNPEKPAYYPHTMPGHGAEIVREGKWQLSKEPEVAKPRKSRGVVYETRRSGAEKEEEQPERLISVQDAGDILNVPQSTIGYWIATGRLKERGRVWLARPGGRGIALVSESEAVSLKNERSPMGRIPQRRYKRGKGSKPQ